MVFVKRLDALKQKNRPQILFTIKTNANDCSLSSFIHLFNSMPQLTSTHIAVHTEGKRHKAHAFEQNRTTVAT